MKIGERFIREGDKIVHHKVHDFTAAEHRARVLRDAGKHEFGESKLIGTIDLDMVAMWLKEAGVEWSDTQARAEVIKRKMLSGDFDKFRVWGGTY